VNWNTVNSGAIYELGGVAFSDQSVGIAVGYNYTILRTTDLGLTWQSRYSPGNGLTSVCSLDSSTFLATGTDGVSVSSDGGMTWTLKFLNHFIYDDVKKIDQNSAAIAGYLGTMFKTTDKGQTWIEMYSCTSNELYSICYSDPQNGTAVGNNGTIIHTTTGGVVFVKKISEQIPSNFRLFQNYPNPFNPSTKIKFQIPNFPLMKGARGMSVRLTIYDLLGREIATLVNQKLQSGTYEVEWDATNYPSGVYFYRLKTDSFNETKKMVLIK
jgi:hypothetical protein